MRFKLENNILYLQPKQGVLLKYGHVKASTQSWVDLPKNGPNRTLATTNYETDREKFALGYMEIPAGTVVTGTFIQLL